MNNDVLNNLKQRRSIYALGKNVKQSNQEIVELIESIIENSPSSFNSQSTRAIILFGDKHDQLWDIVAKRLKSEVPTEAAYQKTLEKINSFKAAYGTVMMFTDMDVIKNLEDNFPLYKDNFYDWSEQAIGNVSLAFWTALATNNIGMNMQHYNPIIDDEVRAAFDVPANWRLRAQMPFGSIEAPAGDKDFMDRADRFRVLGD